MFEKREPVANLEVPKPNLNSHSHHHCQHNFYDNFHCYVHRLQKRIFLKRFSVFFVFVVFLFFYNVRHFVFSPLFFVICFSCFFLL